MATDQEVKEFLSRYQEPISRRALKLRNLILVQLPNIIEQIDLPAKMIAYCYGQKYVDLICVLIPSKKGLKLGFNRGTELIDRQGILEGKGKISRYVDLKTEDQVDSLPLKDLIAQALKLYQQKI